jgi:hypothetical protein
MPTLGVVGVEFRRGVSQSVCSVVFNDALALDCPAIIGRTGGIEERFATG